MRSIIIILLSSFLLVQCESVTSPVSDNDNQNQSGELQKTELVSPQDGSDQLSTSIVLDWKSVSEATSYNLMIGRDQAFEDIVLDTTITADSLEVTGLPFSSTLYWQVQTQNDQATSSWTDTWNFTTKEAPSDPPPADTDIWVTAYMASWNHYAPPTGNWGNLATKEIEWDSFTHMIYFAVVPYSDGSLSEVAPYENLNPDRLNEITEAAHLANKPVIISVGGWGTYDGFSQAITPEVRSTFVDNLIAFMEEWGFDGIDLDMEPIRTSDEENYKAFVKELHQKLQDKTTPYGSRPFLTAATSWKPALFSELQEYFDQINMMTYDFSGAWQGWVSWHNSNLYNGGLTFPSTGEPLPSINERVTEFLNSDIPSSKLGIGIDFYGYVWSGGTGTPTGGVTAPNQSWDTAPTVTDNVPYHSLMNDYDENSLYKWDDTAKAPYLSIDNSGSSDDKFISYDDEKLISLKIQYTRDQNLGGVIIWELSGGYQENEPEGEQNKLLDAVKNAVWY